MQASCANRDTRAADTRWPLVPRTVPGLVQTRGPHGRLTLKEPGGVRGTPGWISTPVPRRQNEVFRWRAQCVMRRVHTLCNAMPTKRNQAHRKIASSAMTIHGAQSTLSRKPVHLLVRWMIGDHAIGG
jgi:hypothetical protein